MRIKSKTVMEQMNSEKPDDVLADLKAKHGSSAPPCSAKVVYEGDQKKIEWDGNRVAVCRCKTVPDGINAIAVEMYHAPTRHATKFVLTENGAAALTTLLSDALSPNAAGEPRPPQANPK